VNEQGMTESARPAAATKHETTLTRVSDREVVISRTFRAPPRIVFEAWTNAEFVKRWWAPRSHGVEGVEFQADVCVGGNYRYVMRPPDADSVTFSGTYSEVTPHTRLVYTMRFEAFPGEMIITVTFEDQGGKTHLVSRELYPSKEALDGALACGMDEGAYDSMNQLDELVASLC
jgi:uncharacterized protein YndB with AHSA1/START domain